MKKAFRKIIVSILTIALIASMSAIVPVFAEDATEPKAMFFDRTYADMWESQNTVEPIVNIDLTTAVWSSYLNWNSEYTNIGALNKLTGDSGGNGNSYKFGTTSAQTDDTLVINLPKKEGYTLNSVGIRVMGDSENAIEMTLFDYYYSINGTDWTSVEHTCSRNLGTMFDRGKQYAFNECVSLPDTAKFLKIKLNSTYSTKYGSVTKCFISVFGFTFAYLPNDAEVVSIKASNGDEMINILSSGLLGENANKWMYAQTNGGKTAYGLVLKSYQDGTSYNATIDALEGYKITSFKTTMEQQQSGNRKLVFTLGDQNASFPDTAVHPATTFSLSYPSGSEAVTISAPRYDAYGMTDVEITMKKYVPELAFEITSAVVDGENVKATVDITNISASEKDSMILLVAGYEGSNMIDVDIIPVSKEDASNIYPATLLGNTTKVRAFLWNDLTTLVPVLVPTPDFPVGQ